MAETCFRPREQDLDDVFGATRRGRLRTFWLAHCHLFAPAFGSNDVARKFLDSLVYRDELTALRPSNGGITKVVTIIEPYTPGYLPQSTQTVTLEKPAAAIVVNNITDYAALQCGYVSDSQVGIAFKGQ